jgi:hypothetical protein
MGRRRFPAEVHGSNAIDVFAISNDGHLLHLGYANDGWAFALEEWKGTTIGGGPGNSRIDRKGPRNLDLIREVTQRIRLPYPAIRGFVGPKRFPRFLKARLPGGLRNRGDILR